MKEKIVVRNLQFGYNIGNPLISCQNLELSPGNIYVFIGENGSGKTTFVKLLLGLLKPDCGEIQGRNNYITGYVPDYNGLYSTMTLLENIKFRLALYNLSYPEMKQEVDDLLDRYNLLYARNMLVNHLSLGMQKKAALACTILTKPNLLVMDEPTVGIDSAAQTELIKMILSYLSQDTIVICTSHDAHFIDALPCQRVMFPMEN